MSKREEIYGKDWPLISAKVKAEKNYTCGECGNTRDLKRNIRIGVHHSDGNPKNNQRTNLECICNICHLKKQKFLQAKYLFMKKEEQGQRSLLKT